MSPEPADSAERQASLAAIHRLVRLNPPGNVSLAGAYALGYGALGMTQDEGTTPDWYNDLDAFDLIALGAVFPGLFRDEYDFANARDAWLRLLRGTVHWGGVERLVRLIVDLSAERDLPVDEAELLLLVAGRVEAAQLDQRKIPRRLLPGPALASSRAVNGPPGTTPVGPPADDAAQAVDRFWAATDVFLPHDGTPADALRQGVHMFAQLGIAVREHPEALLSALYAALAAKKSAGLPEDLPAQATAWAWALDPQSPLIPVTDTMIAGAAQGLESDDILARLLAIPEFTQTTSAQDQRPARKPGDALTDLAFELGYPQLLRGQQRIVSLDADATLVFQQQRELFEAKFGRAMGPDDPVFFDPAADEPTPISAVDLENYTTGMLTALGIHPAWIYANQHTDGLLPSLDGTFRSDADRRDWDDAVNRYLGNHPGVSVDHTLETGKLRTGAGLMALTNARAHPAFARSLLQRWQSGHVAPLSDTGLAAQFLEDISDFLLDKLVNEPDVTAQAKEYARAWSGADLAGDVDAAASGDTPQHRPAVLLAAFAVAGIPLADDDFDDEDHDFFDLEGDPRDICVDLIEYVADSGDIDAPRRLVEELDALNEQELPTVATLTAVASAVLTAVREAGVTPERVEDAIEWVGEGDPENALPVLLVAALAGHKRGQEKARQLYKASDVTVAHLGQALGTDLFPAMIWLCAGLVATADDGDLGWLHPNPTP